MLQNLGLIVLGIGLMINAWIDMEQTAEYRKQIKDNKQVIHLLEYNIDILGKKIQSLENVNQD